jgi:hypothetical protein
MTGRGSESRSANWLSSAGNETADLVLSSTDGGKDQAARDFESGSAIRGADA